MQSGRRHDSLADKPIHADARTGLRAAMAVITAGSVAISVATVVLVDESYRLAAAGIMLCLSTLLAHKLTGSLLLPLNALHDGLVRIGRGNLGGPVPVRGGAELGQLAEDINELARQLKKTRKRTEARERAMINTLGRVAEGRSSESVNHMLRVGAMSRELARLAGLKDEDCDILSQAAPLHDLGKVGIPDTILSKPGRYTPGEFAAMRSHAEIGHRILAGSKSPAMRAAAVIALTHHERWDGRGYPRGISGEEIPLNGRIVGLVDAFDAICSDRPYRKAMPAETGLSIIRSQRGHHFDPRLVDIFTEHLPTFLDIIEKRRDQATAMAADGVEKASDTELCV